MASRTRQALLLGLILLVALAVRLFRIPGHLMEDELFHAQLAASPWGDILGHCTVSTTYPAYYLLVKAWTALVPATDLGLKAHSLAWGLAAVAGIFFAGRRMAGPATGLAAALLLALLGYHAHFSQQALHYAWLCMLGVAAPWTLLALLQGGGWRWGALHAMVLAAALNTYPASLLLLGGETTALVALRWGRAEVHLKAAAGALVSGVLLGSGGLYLMLIQWPIAARFGQPFIPPVTLEVVAARLHNIAAYGSAMTWTAPLEILAGAALFLSGGGALLGLARRSAGHHLAWKQAVVFCLGGVPLLTYILSGLVLKDFLYEARFVALLVPSLVLGVAGAATLGWRDGQVAMAGKVRILGPLLLLAVLIPQAGSFAHLYGEGRSRDNFPVDEASAWIQQRARIGDLAVVHHSWYLPFFQRYYRYPEPAFMGAVTEGILQVPFGGVRRRTTPPDVKAVLSRARGHGRIFLVLSVTANREWRDPRGLLRQAADRQLELLESTCINCGEGGFPTEIRLYAVPQKR